MVDGNYVLPSRPGYSSMHTVSIEEYAYPGGGFWSGLTATPH